MMTIQKWRWFHAYASRDVSCSCVNLFIVWRCKMSYLILGCGMIVLSGMVGVLGFVMMVAF